MRTLLILAALTGCCACPSIVPAVPAPRSPLIIPPHADLPLPPPEAPQPGFWER